jgi:polyhydroxyalkanoate synthesis regulator phasin
VRDEIRRLALFGSGVVELTRHRAEQMVKELVKAGDVRRQEASGTVKELLERSRENRRELSRFVRAELQNQIATLGLATKRDLERMERRITRLEGRSSAAKSTSKKTTAKKTTAKKTTRKPSSTNH